MCKYGSSVFPPLLTVGGRWRALRAHRTVWFSYWGWRRCRSAPSHLRQWRSRRSGSTVSISGPAVAVLEELLWKVIYETPSFMSRFETCDHVMAASAGCNYLPAALMHVTLSLARTSSSSHRQTMRCVSSSRLQLSDWQWLQFSCTLISHSPWLSMAKIHTQPIRKGFSYTLSLKVHVCDELFVQWKTWTIISFMSPWSLTSSTLRWFSIHTQYLNILISINQILECMTKRELHCFWTQSNNINNYTIRLVI